jgi:hypothetical protein
METESKKQKAKELVIGHWPLVISPLLAFPLLLLWRPLLAGESFYWGTPLLQFVPWLRLAAEMWRSGQTPLWNPLVGCGAPLAANYQTGAFYPLNALHLLLPTEVALSWTVALHVALAGLAMYAWGRSVGLERFPALVGALALEGSGFLVARAALFPSIALTFPWIAIWLWRGEVLARRGRLRDALWLGLALGMGLLAGHAQTAFYGGLLLAAYLVFRVRSEIRDRRLAIGDWRIASLVIVSLFIGIGLAAVQLLPTAELMLQSQRAGGVGYDLATTYSFWPWRLLTFFAPDFFGNPGRGDYWGYASYWEDAGYVGVLPLLLAVGAVVARIRHRSAPCGRPGQAQDLPLHGRPSRQVWFWVVCGSVALVLALGKNTPLFPFLFRYVPTFNLFQSPARWLAVTTVALAALTGIGAQAWPIGRAGLRRGAVWLVIGAALGIAGLAAPRLIASERLVTFGAATLRLGVTLAVAGALVLLRPDATARQAHGKRWWHAAVVAFVAFDLLLFGWPLVPTVDRALYQSHTQTAAILRELPPGRVYWPSDPAHPGSERDAEYRVKFGYLTFHSFGPRDAAYWRGMREALIPNAGMLDGVASANNFDPLLVARYAELMRVVPTAPSLLRAMGVTYIAGLQIADCRLQIATSQTPIAICRLPDTLGRVWVVPTARQVSPEEMLTTLANPAFDPAAEVLIEVPPPYSLPTTSYSLIPNPYSLSLHDTPNGVTIRAALDAPGYLVLADTWYPGWQATVDGEPTGLLRANYAFRAVYLEAGEHTVEMVYRPQSFIIGAVVSGVAMACWLVSWLVCWLRGRRG